MSMRQFRIVVLVVVLVCFAPLLSAVLAGSIASSFGCTLHEGFANPCLIGGVDWGETLYALGMMGWFMIATLPIAALVLLVWLIVELVAAVRRRRAAPRPN